MEIVNYKPVQSQFYQSCTLNHERVNKFLQQFLLFFVKHCMVSFCIALLKILIWMKCILNLNPIIYIQKVPHMLGNIKERLVLPAY